MPLRCLRKPSCRLISALYWDRKRFQRILSLSSEIDRSPRETFLQGFLRISCSTNEREKETERNLWEREMKRGRKDRDWREVLYGNGVEGSEREMEGSGFLRPTLLFHLTCNYKERIVFIFTRDWFCFGILGATEIPFGSWVDRKGVVL